MLDNQNPEQENNSVFSSLYDFMNRGTFFPTAEALVPLNPQKIPSYSLGSILTLDQRFKRNDLLQPVRNIEASFEYLSSSHNDTH